MNRRSLLARLGLAAAGVGGAWWLKDNVLWRRPEIAFPASAEWIDYDEPRASLPTVLATVDGQTVRALIDSGAQFSVIDRGLFDALGRPTAEGFDPPDQPRTMDLPLVAYGVGGNPQMGRGTTLDVTVGGVRIEALRAVILALGPLALRDGLSVPLILGQDVLSRLTLDLDTRERRLRLLPAGSPMPEGYEILATQRAGRALSMEVTVEAAPIRAVIDTGSSSLLAISQSTAQTVGLLDGRPRRDSGSIVLGGTLASTTVTARTVTVGDTLYRDTDLSIYPDQPIPGFPQALLGMDAFDGRRLRMDLGAGLIGVSREMDLTVGPG